MQILNQLKANNKIKKSHTLIFGSLLIFSGVISLSWNYFLRMRDSIYSDMRIQMMDDTIVKTEELVSATEVISDAPVPISEPTANENYYVDFSQYLGVLEIPKIGLKRGFYEVGNKYNSIEYNVTVIKGSTMPDVVNGNLMLMAHSGDAWISFFAYLYKLNIGDEVYVTYNGRKYQYNIVNIYVVDKIGVVPIRRNYDKTTLTMITCTKDNAYTQTVYIAELVG